MFSTQTGNTRDILKDDDEEKKIENEIKEMKQKEKNEENEERKKNNMILQQKFAIKQTMKVEKMEHAQDG